MNDYNKNEGDGLYKKKYHIQKVKYVKNPNFNGNRVAGIDVDSLFLEHRVPVDKDAEYFVLRLDENQDDKIHMCACRIAIHAYADIIKSNLPQLAIDLKQKYPLLMP